MGSLEALLKRIGWERGDCHLWLCGDLVNRGDRSLETLRFCRANESRIQVVLGNHDLHLLAVGYTRKDAKRKDTLKEILEAPDRDDLLQWLRKQPLVHYDAHRRAALVHAGFHPDWRIEDALERADEVEKVLSSADCKSFLGKMYGNEPDRWKDKLAGMDRLRVITNIMTRMRFLSASGQLDMVSKGGPDTAPKGFRPWFEYPRPDDVKIFFGHWASLQGKCQVPGITALDTGCVWGNELTAVNVDTGESVSVPGLGKL